MGSVKKGVFKVYFCKFITKEIPTHMFVLWNLRNFKEHLFWRTSGTRSAKLRPRTVLRTTLKDVVWTSPYGLLCNANGTSLPTSWRRPLPTSLGRWKMTSRGRPNVTSWGRPYTGLYVTPWDVPYWRLEDESCRRFEDIPRRSNIYFQGTCFTDVLRTSLRDVLSTS